MTAIYCAIYPIRFSATADEAVVDAGHFLYHALVITGEHIVPSVFRDMAYETCIVVNENFKKASR